MRRLFNRFLDWLFPAPVPEWRCEQCGALGMDCDCQDPPE